MAKIRVAQIKDLNLTPNSGIQTLTVGEATITPLDEISTTATEVTDATSFLTGLAVNGNAITPEYKTIASVLETLTGSATIANVSDGVVTLKAGIVEADGKISNSNGADITLAKVATTGAAVDVTIADAEGVITATTVEGALAEIAKEIDGMDSEFELGTLVKVNLTQVDGKVTEFTTDETALNNRLTELQSDTTLEGVEAIEVTYDDTVGEGEEARTANTVSLKIANGEKVLSQDGNGLKSTLNLTYDSTAKQIKLWGISTTEPIATVDATDFIKDGMLADAEIITASNEEGLTPGKRYIKFTFKTYQYGVEGQETLKVEYLDVESLFDSYTAGNDWIEIDQATNKISHKTVNGLDSTNAHGITADVTVNNTEPKTFKVPTLTVDAAGHVTSVDEKTVTISLPTSIQEIEIDGGDYITATATKTGTTETIALEANIGRFSHETEDGQTVATVDGLATTTDVEEYVEDYVANNAATTMYREVLNGVSAIDSEATLTYIPVGDVAITQNGIDLDFDEYTIGGEEGKTVSFTIDEDVDVKDGDVFVAYYMYNPNTQLQQNA